MVSKLIVSTVLLGVIALLSWVGWWTCSHQFENFGNKVILLLVESGVLLAATSLLVETFQSFGSLSVKKRSWKGAFLYNSYEEGQSVRTCELFACRSMVLALVGLVIAMCVVVMWEAVKFLFNPHAITVNWIEVGQGAALLVSLFVYMLVSVGGFSWLWKKFASRSQIFAWIMSGLYWAVAISIYFGFMSLIFLKDPSLIAMPYYWAFLCVSGVVFLCLLFLGAVVGLGLGLFKLAGKAILGLRQRFPIIAEVYNTICPVQTIHFVE